MHILDLKKSQILDRVDLIGVISEHVSLRQRGRRWVGLCPFHSEKTPSFTVSPDLGIFKCFGCGKGGDVFSFVQARENVSFYEALKLLADRAGVELSPQRGEASNGPGRSDVAKVNEWAARHFQSNLANESLGASTRTYLRQRGLSDEMVERFRLGLAISKGPSLLQAAKRAGFDEPLLLAADLVRQSDRGSSDRDSGDGGSRSGGSTYETFRNRVIFPIKDATNRYVGFGGRALGDDPAKYLNTRQNILFDKGRGLYGIDLARNAITKNGRAIVVEGYTDCLAAHQAGFDYTVATLGTALTEAQVDLLRRYCDEVILLFDSDKAGLAASDRAIRVALPRHISVRIARIPDGLDPCEFLSNRGSDAFSDVLNRSVDALEFKWSQTQRQLGETASAPRKREAILDFVGIIVEAFGTGAVDEIQRGQIALRVAEVLKIESRQVHQLFARLESKRAGASRRRAASPAPGVSDAAAGGDSRNSDGGSNVGGIGHRPERGQDRSPDRQIEWITLLEIGLQEPGLLAAESDLPDPAGILDDGDRRIAEIVFDLAKQVGEFQVSDVLSRCADEVDAQRVAELAAQWGDRGNFEKTFQLALERIRVAGQQQEVDQSRDRFLNLSLEEKDGASARDELAKLQQGLRVRRHFVPNRLSTPIASAVATAGQEEPSTTGAPVTVME